MGNGNAKEVERDAGFIPHSNIPIEVIFGRKGIAES
jgi:hypothetical protein